MKSFLFGALCSTVFLLSACTGAKPDGEAATAATADTTAAPMPPAEFADAKYAQLARAAQDLFAAGDIAAWSGQFADDAVYLWNNGDSLAGKAAISEYWTKRRNDVIESISFTNHIYLPVNVNTPQSVEQAGVWVLSWYQTEAKYKSGKTMAQWIHTDLHYNADDKVDRVIQYIDRSVITAAEK